jgi:hypothetical protein
MRRAYPLLHILLIAAMFLAAVAVSGGVPLAGASVAPEISAPFALALAYAAP